MASDQNTADNWWAAPASKKDPNKFEFGSDLPIDLDTNNPAKDSTVQENQESRLRDLEQSRTTLMKKDSYDDFYHGKGDDFAGMVKKVEVGDMEPRDFVLQTGMVFTGTRTSTQQRQRDLQLSGVGPITAPTPGLDQWHRWNDNKGQRPLDPSLQPAQSWKSDARGPMSIIPVDRQAIARIQTPISLPPAPQAVQQPQKKKVTSA